jgi:hypothetical protein
MLPQHIGEFPRRDRGKCGLSGNRVPIDARQEAYCPGNTHTQAAVMVT